MGRHLNLRRKRSRLVPNILRGRAAEYIIDIDNPLGEGGYSGAFGGKITKILHGGPGRAHAPKLGQGQRVVIKVPNLDLGRTVPDLQSRLVRIFEEMSRSYGTVNRLNDVDCVAHILDIGTFEFQHKGELLVAPFLVEELIEGIPFSTWLKHQFKNMDGAFSGISQADQFLSLAKQLTELVSKIHQHGIIHGDIWSDNILVCGDLLYLIDFGSCVFREYSYPRRDQCKWHPYIAPERWRGEAEGRRSDIYSLGAVFFYMAAGKDPPQFQTDIEKLKKQVYNLIMEHNPQLLHQNCAVADIVARCVRYEKDLRTRDAEVLLSEIKTFSFAFAGASVKESISKKLKKIIKIITHLNESEQRMVDIELNPFVALIYDMLKGIHEITGNHETLVSRMCRYMSTLEKGDILLIRSTPHLWKTENLGVNGRFLSMIRLLVQRGVKFTHLFLACNDDFDDPDVRVVFEAHLNMLHDLSAATSAAPIEVMYLPVSRSEREKMLWNGWQKGIVVRKGKASFFDPILDARGRLRSVRVLARGPDLAVVKRDLEHEKARAKQLDLWSVMGRKQHLRRRGLSQRAFKGNFQQLHLS